MLKKNVIRNLMADKRNNLNESFIKASSLKIAGIAYGYAMDNSFKNIAIYMSIKNEVRMEYIIELNKGKNIDIFLPVCANADDIYYNKFEDIDSMRKDFFGISCPKDGYSINKNDIEAFFIPGLAFDLTGNRVGYGRGYFDKALADISRPLFVGVCYEFQLISCDVIEMNDYDVKMNYILTENGMRKVNNLE